MFYTINYNYFSDNFRTNMFLLRQKALNWELDYWELGEDTVVTKRIQM